MFKNTIIYENDHTIKKVFKDELDYYTEYHFYEQFKDFEYIPKVFTPPQLHEPGMIGVLYLEYIPGDSIYNLSMEKQIKVARTLALFHNVSYHPESELALVHFDTNLNNYLYFRDQIYMIDFSDVSIESPLVDIYSILLFFCEIYSPADFTIFVEKFYHTYSAHFSHRLKHDKKILDREINRFENRRNEYNKSIYNYEDYLVNKGIMLLKIARKLTIEN